MDLILLYIDSQKIKKFKKKNHNTLGPGYQCIIPGVFNHELIWKLFKRINACVND